MSLHIKTLGIPELLTREGDTQGCLRLRYRKAYALLGYLAVQRNRWHERRRLADFFWAHLPPDAALANLRQVLKNLADVFAGTIGAHALRVERDRLGLFFDAALDADVLLLDDANCEALRRCASRDDFVRLTAAWQPWLEQMEGEFLAGIDADDSGEFQDWLLLQRAFCERARAAFLRAHLQAARRCDAPADALKAAQAWVRCRPADDEAAQAQMELLAALGRPAAALDAHADFVERLECLIGRAPAEDTDALRQRIATAAANGADEDAAATRRVDEVRRVVVLQIEPDLDDETDELEPETRLAPLEAALAVALSRWHGQRIATAGLALGAVFGLADDGEQAPRRALEAALEIAAQALFGRTRIGICEGKALVCPDARHPLAGSALPTLAQRLALCGEAGDVIVADTLAGELGPRAGFAALPRRRFTGLAGEHAPCRLVLTDGVQIDPYPATFATPFIGRRAERADLDAALRTSEREGRVVFVEVAGLAGTGKSRLLAELARQHAAAGGEIRWVGHRPELRHVSLGALRESLRRRFGAQDGSGPATGLDDWLARSVPLRREALGAPLRAFLAVDGDSGISGRGLVEALLTLLFTPSGTQRPVLLVFDDLHWADAATRELLQLAMQSPPAAPVLAVLACRPAAGVEPPPDVALPRIALQPMALAESLALIAAIDHDGRINGAQRRQLARMSGGLPLHAEYVAHSARDQPVSDASLFGVLQGLLDRLGADKQVLQAAAVLGAAFRGAALRALLPQHDTGAALERAARLAISMRTGKDAYAFRHALLRDCAYESIPPKLRRDWHRQAAALAARQEDAAPADIAQHFEAAQAWRAARTSWWQAAQTAYLGEFAGDAREAAVRSLAAAAKDSAPLAPEERAELELLAGYAALMADGYGAKDAQRFFAPTAARSSGELPDETLIRALCGMAAAIPQGRSETLAIMQRLDTMARLPAHRMMVCYGFGSLLFWRGEFAASLHNMEEAIRLGETLPARVWLRYSADSPVVACRALKGINLAFSGSAAAAQEAAELAVADARQGGRTHGLCFALTMAASVHLVLDHPDDVELFAAEGLELASQRNFQLWRAYNTFFGLWAKARQGRLRLASSFKLISMHREFAAASRLSPVTSLWFVGCIFEALGNWSLLDASSGRALALAENGGDRYCMPDLMRQKSLARLGRGDEPGARRWLEQGRALAVQHGSLGLLRRLGLADRRIASPGTLGDFA